MSYEEEKGREEYFNQLAEEQREREHIQEQEQNYIQFLEAQNQTLREIVELLKKSNAFYADPENRKEEWVYDMDYYDPNPPLRRTVLQHGKLARSTQKQVEELEKKLK